MQKVSKFFIVGKQSNNYYEQNRIIMQPITQGEKTKKIELICRGD